MSNILSIGSRALQANEVVLQTIGNNITNVNTPGYSRQTVLLSPVTGQYSGGGYIGKGVQVETIQRNYDTYLAQQATLAATTYAADNTRAGQLNQLQGIFTTGTDGLGSAINSMLNNFSDVASAPTDLTARTVALTSVDETAARMRAAAQNLSDLQSGLTNSLTSDVSTINNLAQNIASANAQVVQAQALGQPPNDLLDKRDQLINQLNQYVQTSSVQDKDGSINLFIGGSQSLVLGSTASKVSVVPTTYGDPTQSKLAISHGSQTITMDETMLGGGELSGLLRFQNTDLNEARNLLGRLTLAITTSMNNQHKLGLDLNGQPGGNLFTPAAFSGQNILSPQPPATLNTGTYPAAPATPLTLAVNNPAQLVPSDYQVNFTGAGTGSITRLSDGTVFNFPQAPPAAAPLFATVDGLNFGLPAGAVPAAGDSFMVKPFSTIATTVSSQFSTPASLAVASPVAASAATSNQGALQLVSLNATGSAAPIAPYAINFTVVAGVTSYNIVDMTGVPPAPVPPPVATGSYVPGQAIAYSPGTGLPGFSITLSGAPVNGDSFTVQSNPYPKTDSGNASAMAALRDVPTFDGAPMSDGYASLIADLGVRTQSAQYAAKVSSTIATSTSQAQAGVSSVNLDEEASKMLQYQQAYQASAKVISTAQSLFNSLLAAFP